MINGAVEQTQRCRELGIIGTAPSYNVVNGFFEVAEVAGFPEKQIQSLPGYEG